MNSRLPAVTLALIVGTIMLVRAGEAPPFTYGAEYVSGHAGFVKTKRGGQLAIGSDAVTFSETDFRSLRRPVLKPLFSIPLAIIVSAVATTERENYFGAFSANAVRNQDYVTITTETTDSAEAVVFKVGDKQAAGIAVKVQFAAKQAKASDVERFLELDRR